MSGEDLDGRRERLRRQLTDITYCDQYADSVLFENVSAQVQALRRQRGITQEQLAERIGSKQPRISNVESPKGKGEWPNWEVSTLNRIAHALGTRLKITLESYGSMVGEVGTFTSDSLRRPAFADDPVIFPLPAAPVPDPAAPERTRWMQELMIPWLWTDQLELERLYDWLRGGGLPPVGYDDEPYQWLLRGIAIHGPARDHLEKRFAERLSILLGEEPDVVMRDGGEDFLRNLYWTCAGLRRPSYLAEHLWQAYRRLKRTKLRGDVKDALQAALIQNQFGASKPLEIWEKMVTTGHHSWLRGGEIAGYEGILARHATITKDIDKVLWALGRISHRWDPSKKADFRRLMLRVPDLDQTEGAKLLIKSASDSKAGWSEWAVELLPQLSYPKIHDGSLRIVVKFEGNEVYAHWLANGSAQTGLRRRGSFVDQGIQPSGLSGPPQRKLLLNELLTRLGNDSQMIEHALVFDHLFTKDLLLATVEEELEHPRAA